MNDQTPRPAKISLLLADVDGTLVDSRKQLTGRTKAAIESLAAGHEGFAEAVERFLLP